MPNLPIVALYAGLHGLILLWLAATVSRIRWRTGIWLGDGGSEELVRATRGLANFAEYVPLVLLMMLLLAGLGMPGYLLLVFGLTLTAARILHGLHFAGVLDTVVARQVGASVTFVVVLLASLGLVVHAVMQLA